MDLLLELLGVVLACLVGLCVRLGKRLKLPCVWLVLVDLEEVAEQFKHIFFKPFVRSRTSSTCNSLLGVEATNHHIGKILPLTFAHVTIGINLAGLGRRGEAGLGT